MTDTPNDPVNTPEPAGTNGPADRNESVTEPIVPAAEQQAQAPAQQPERP